MQVLQRTNHRPFKLTEEDLAKFSQDGYLMIRNFCENAVCEEMLAAINSSLHPALAPVEYEAEVQYPGAPESRLSPGGDTPRRLLNAFARDEVFRRWATARQVGSIVKSLLGVSRVLASQNHHNCIMTKYPGYGSSTGWHQDIRYWRFDRPDLVTLWLALGEENKQNGSLSVIPGTHRFHYDRGQFDAAYFFRTDLKQNNELVKSSIDIEMSAGDVLFFHCRLLHCARQNHSDQVKISVVFTYHASNNYPIVGTRSAEHPDIELRNME